MSDRQIEIASQDLDEIIVTPTPLKNFNDVVHGVSLPAHSIPADYKTKIPLLSEYASTNFTPVVEPKSGAIELAFKTGAASVKKSHFRFFKHKIISSKQLEKDVTSAVAETKRQLKKMEKEKIRLNKKVKRTSTKETNSRLVDANKVAMSLGAATWVFGMIFAVLLLTI